MSEHAQTSFIGGMNLLATDTMLQPNQYRMGFNLRNRYAALDEIRSSTKDESGNIVGVKQGIITFGNYVVLFVAGNAFYKAYDQTAWTRITQFSMSTTAERYWTAAVPVSITRYGRYSIASPSTGNTLAGINNVQSIVAASAGNLPGLLVAMMSFGIRFR